MSNPTAPNYSHHNPFPRDFTYIQSATTEAR